MSKPPVNFVDLVKTFISQLTVELLINFQKLFKSYSDPLYHKMHVSQKEKRYTFDVEEGLPFSRC